MVNYDLNSMTSLYGINLEELGYNYPYFTITTNTCMNTENSNELKINVKKHQIKFNFNL